jgi:asparagine synthase (glutamine-hydrolysing)
MCGLVGRYDRRGRGRADPRTCELMASRIQHRGPDSAGAYSWPEAAANLALAVRRLSVIDLDTGDQPISSEAATIVVGCNGEIYNYIELRADLETAGHQFRTSSDVEVLVHLYEQHGLTMFNHLRGMYALALWDRPRERLLLAVDPMGVKPLYYVEVDGILRFASEVKAFSADGGIELRPDLQAVDTYLSFGYMIGGETLFSGIHRLLPGHALVVEGGRARTIHHGSSREAHVSRPKGGQPPAGRIQALLQESIELQLRSDVPVGMFLSGGLDSSAMLAIASQLAPEPIPTYTVGYEGLAGSMEDETRQASEVASLFKADHHQLLLSADDWWQALQAYVSIQDEPIANPSAVSMLPLAGLATRDVKVVLTGLGGDELFHGYPHHARLPVDIRIGRRLRRWLPEPLVDTLAATLLPTFHRVYPSVRRTRGLSGAWLWAQTRLRVLDRTDEMLKAALSFEGVAGCEDLRHQLYTSELRAARREHHKERQFQDLLRHVTSSHEQGLVRQLVMRTWLPGNGLLSLDHVTMAHSLEARVPFFDPMLTAAASRYAGLGPMNGDKPLLRAAMAGTLPPRILERRKHPFATPLRHWFDHELADPVQAVLLDAGTLHRGLFCPQALRRLVEDHFSGRADHTEMLFRLVIFELWCRLWVDR